jgi:hypothetical protein
MSPSVATNANSTKLLHFLSFWHSGAEQEKRIFFLEARHGGVHTPQKWFAPPPKGIWHPRTLHLFWFDFIFDYYLILVSYLIILTTKFVKLPILWSQISPCRPRKHILLNFFLGLSGRCYHAPAKASSSTPPPPDIYPPPRTKIWKSVSAGSTTCRQKYSADQRSIFVLNLHKHIVF